MSRILYGSLTGSFHVFCAWSGLLMKRNWPTRPTEPDRKTNRFSIVSWFPVVAVPDSHAMFRLLIPATGLSCVSPPRTVGTLSTLLKAPPVPQLPDHMVLELAMRNSAPVLNACLPLVQLIVSAYVVR